MHDHTPAQTEGEHIPGPGLSDCEVHGLTRASFILRGALAAGAVYGVGAVTPFVSQALAQSGGGDLEILNFALTLEYLESDFYNVKGRTVGLSGEARSYAEMFGRQEQDHVDALLATIKQLGGIPAAKPSFGFPATDERSFLALASTLENTGVGAYNGAAPMLQSKKVLAAAGSIVQTEARHAAAINLLIARTPTPNQGFDLPIEKAKVLTAVGPLIK